MNNDDLIERLGQAQQKVMEGLDADVDTTFNTDD